MNMPLVLLNRRRRGGSFSPYSLFSGTAIGTWFDPSDLSTMYQDAAGTTAVTTPGQPVGLRLDKSKGLALGADTAVNGSFATDTGWTKDAGWTIASGKASTSGSTGYLYQNGSAAKVVGFVYKITFTVSDYVSGNVIPYISGVAPTGTPFNSNGDKTVYLRAINTSAEQGFAPPGAGSSFSIDNISVKELPGNHATQSVLASRPVYGIEPAGGRRNLLTYTEVFSDSAWIKASGAAITANTDTAPDGTLTADTLTTSGVPSFGAGLITQAVSVAATGVTFTFSAYLKASSTSKATIWLNLAGGAERVAVVVNLTSSYQRYTVSATFTSGSIVYPHVVAGDANLGTNAGSVFIWGAQLETGSAATPYQKVVSAFDVTEAGVQSCHYVQYDGINHGMITNSIDFTATDKMSVFAGVRKLVDQVGMVAEFGATGTVAGGFKIGVSTSAADVARRTWFVGQDGGGFEVIGGAALYPSPDTRIQTGLFDRSASTQAAELRLQLNGVAQTLVFSIADLSTGNFGNHRLNIGRRGNDQTTPTAPFYGRDYGIVVVGKATTADEITSTERWLSGKTGFYAPIITGVPTIGVS